ncbi:MAG: hypothetical protein GY847_12885 [Proteobacteria bacterium]|nr:hypothetical protein [Pseudomonadota bacterium]
MMTFIKRQRFATVTSIALLLFLAAKIVGCDDDDNDIDNQVGSACETAEHCFPDVDPDEIIGEVVCMDRVKDGYCTHHCNKDEDCCAIKGECEGDLPQVCGPFESTGKKFCFLSCEDIEDEENYCQLNAHEEFICRSTGGGSENRKVCVPEG